MLCPWFWCTGKPLTSTVSVQVAKDNCCLALLTDLCNLWMHIDMVWVERRLCGQEKSIGAIVFCLPSSGMTGLIVFWELLCLEIMDWFKNSYICTIHDSLQFVGARFLIYPVINILCFCSLFFWIGARTSHKCHTTWRWIKPSWNYLILVDLSDRAWRCGGSSPCKC
jgi:hypothetical protein